MYNISLKLTIKTFEQISPIAGVSVVDFKQVNAGCDTFNW